MEVMMKKIQHKKIISLLGIMVLMSITSPAQAQWPTLDISAIAEGIKSKIELVKQSKIITETTQLAGKMNSAIGDAKASMSKFAGDTIEKAKKQAEKLQKAKERLDKAKEKMEKAKEKAAKAKEKMEKAKAKIEKAKAEIEKAKEKAQSIANDVKSEVDKAKEIANDVKSEVDKAKEIANDVKSEVDNAKTQINDVKETISDAQNVANDAMSSAKNSVSSISSEVNSAISNNDFVSDYVANYEAGINSDGKIYEQPQAINSANTSGTTQSMSTRRAFTVAPSDTANSNNLPSAFSAAPSDTANSNNLPSAFSAAPSDTANSNNLPSAFSAAPSDTANSNNLPSAFSAAPSDTANSNNLPSAFSAAPSDTTNSNNLPSAIGTVSEPNNSSTVKEAPAASRGFRQRAIIKKNSTPSATISGKQGAFLDTLEVKVLASYNTSETLMFGAEDYIPDGVINNGEYEETIIPETLVNYCSIGVDKLEDPTVMENCLKEIIRHQSDPDSQVAEEGKNITNKISAESVIATTTESMQMKNIAANYEEKVLDKFDEQAGSASTTRDDSAVLALTNKEIQYLLNKLVTMQAAQLSQSALSQLGGLTTKDLGEEEGEE